MDVAEHRPRPSTLFEFLIAEREELIRAWMKRVRDDVRIPSADDLTSTLLRDHFPQLLNQIVLALAKQKSGLADPREAAEKVGTSEAAQEHVSMRFLSGYTLVETLRELAQLRTEIVRRWSTAKVNPSADELEVIHASIDEVMAMAADEIHFRTNAAKDVFNARLSHELGTPATAIMGSIETLRNEDRESEKFKKAIDVLSRNSELLVATIENLRDLSQIIFGRLRLTLKDCEPNEIAKLAAETVYTQAVEKRVDINLRLDPSSRHFHADSLKLHQVLLNVLNNAIKYTPSGGSIAFTCSSDSEVVTYEVRDTGEGIAPDFLPHVFEQFRQESTERSARGLGIGLAIAREIVESHGGRISAASPGKGQGSTITIQIPVRAADKAH